MRNDILISINGRCFCPDVFQCLMVVWSYNESLDVSYSDSYETIRDLMLAGF